MKIETCGGPFQKAIGGQNIYKNKWPWNKAIPPVPKVQLFNAFLAPKTNNMISVSLLFNMYNRTLIMYVLLPFTMK